MAPLTRLFDALTFEDSRVHSDSAKGFPTQRHETLKK